METVFLATIRKLRSNTPNLGLKTLILRSSSVSARASTNVSKHRSYNKTRYSGLETHIINSYTNPLIQTLHYVMPMRFVAISHTRNACPREHCLLCELGFVMYSIDDACGVNCQATNFGKTISNLPSGIYMIRDPELFLISRLAAGYGVIDYAQDGQDVDYLSKIQVFNRFLIDSLSTEGNLHPKNPDLFPKLKLTGPFPSAVTQLMGINAKTTVKCNACGNTRVKDGLTHVVDMLYPKKVTIIPLLI